MSRRPGLAEGHSDLNDLRTAQLALKIDAAVRIARPDGGAPPSFLGSKLSRKPFTLSCPMSPSWSGSSSLLRRSRKYAKFHEEKSQ
jgi:hypothetical protein